MLSEQDKVPSVHAIELKTNDRTDTANPSVQNNAAAAKSTTFGFALKTFAQSLALCLIISFCASMFVALELLPTLIRLRLSSTGGTLFLSLFGFYLLFLLYISFLEQYTTFLFSCNMVKEYKINRCIKSSSTCTLIILLLACNAVMIIWGINLIHDIDTFDSNTEYTDVDEFVTHKFTELTSITSPYYWCMSLSIAPVFILFIIFLIVTIYFDCTVSKRINTESNAALLINNDDNNVNLNVNKRILHRVVWFHIVLLITWIIWKWLTTPFVYTKIDRENSVMSIESNRNSVYLSFWTLYIFTIIMKQICRKLIDGFDDEQFENRVLINTKRMRIMLDILIAILFDFGLKFVFTNIGDWIIFIIISITKCILNIFVNGSLQSHQFGKRFLNRIRSLFRLKTINLENEDEIVEYNKALAFKLSVHFIISASSCLIMMSYFAMMIATFGSSVDVKIFEFLSASFGFDCVMYLGQIIAFKKRDRAYFLSSLTEEFTERTSWSSDEDKKKKAMQQMIKGKKVKTEAGKAQVAAIIEKQKPTRHNWCGFLFVCLSLAWVWIGALTGMPTDMNIKADV